MPVILATLATLAAVAAPAVWAQSLSPSNCLSNSVLPSTVQFYQDRARWMGVAVSPQNPTYSVYLEMLSDPVASYSPAVVSEFDNRTNFLLKNFTGDPAAWRYAKALAPGGGNAAHVIQWDPGSGPLQAGNSFAATYGGLTLGCELLRVFEVDLQAGQDYAFTLTTNQSQDDLKMALVREGVRPDGWVTRADALFEEAAGSEGGAAPRIYRAEVTGTHGLAVFVDDLTAEDGVYTVSFDTWAPPADLPDLVVESITPLTATAGTRVDAFVTIRNRGGGTAPASAGRFTFDYGTAVSLATPALAAGGSTIITVDLGVINAAGAHAMWATADYGNAVTEYDETNNARTESLYVGGAVSTPDLTVLSLVPATAVPNLPFTVYATVYNRGTASAGASTTRVEVIPGWAYLDLATPALAVGATAKLQGTMAGVPAGDHDLRAVADWLGAVSELDELNNILAIDFAATGPDLTVEGVSPLAVSGNVAPIYTVTVRNSGNGDAASSFVRLQLDGADECPLVFTPAVPAGAAVAVACTSTTILTPGAHTVTAAADITNAVPEGNETNNSRQVTVTATATSVLVRADGTGTYPTIQAAIDAVAAGGEVLLSAGTYTGAGNRDVTYRGKDVAVIALSGGVIIDCQGDPDNAHRAFVFSSGEGPAAQLIGVTITGGWVETGSGGGILVAGSAPTITGCVVRDCHADAGGAVAFSGSPPGGLRPQLLRCTLTGNSANLGGAAYMDGAVSVMMDNVLIASNYGYGGAIAYGPSASGNLDLDCSDLWGNSGGDFAGPAAGQLEVDGNISRNPLFCDPAAGDFHVASNSPCAEAMNASCGQIGALEAACGPMGGTVRRVEADASGPYLTIQHAINNCVDGDIVELGDGEYTGTGNWDVTTLGKAILVRSASGNPQACRIAAQNAHRGFVFNNGEGPMTVVTGIGVFSGAAAIGAGILCNGASPTLEDLYIGDCNATDDGGGLHCESYASPIISGCRFENNSATDDGGGLYAATWCSPDIDDCVFLGNLSGDRGAGAVFSVNCFPTLDGCTFRGNEGVNGGGLNFTYAYGPVTDCVFMDNFGDYGGGFQGFGNARVDFLRCTFSGNRGSNGSGVYLRANSAPTFTNCVIAFGVTGAAFDRYATDCNPVLSCTDIWGNAGGDWTAMISAQNGANGNFSADPLFCDRAEGVLTLRGDSPCAMVNSGSCGQVGALAVGCSGSWLVRPDGSGDFATIQAAIDAAAAGETVVLADGTYTGTGNRDLDFKGKAITVRSQSGDASACIIDCEGTQAVPHAGVNFVTGETAATRLEHVTIRGAWRFNGAGGRIDAASPTLTGVVFQDNRGDSGGGLILATGAMPRLEDCVFSGNIVSNAGGGLYASASYPQLVRCTFSGNSAYWGGGGLYCQRSGPNVIECRFDGNSSNAWGGGVHARYVESSPNFTDCVFTDNTAPQGGAVYEREGAFPSFTTCTFSGNSSANGAVLHARTSSSANLIRCLLVFSPTGAAVTTDGTAVMNLVCSDIFGNAGGDWTGPIASQAGISGNFAADPVFCSRWDGVLTLSSASPCVPAHSPCGLQVGALGEGCGVTAVDEPSMVLPSSLVLDPNVPNPFNPVTSVRFSTPRECLVEVAVFGLDGRRIALLHDGMLPAGSHELFWRARDERGREAASGIYLVRVRAGEETLVRKMTLLR